MRRKDSPYQSPTTEECYMGALGILVGRLYEGVTNDPGDFDEAIALIQKTLTLASIDGLTRPRAPNQLGLIYAKGFELEGEFEYLDMAINYLQQAALSLPDCNQMTPGVLMQLVELLGKRFARTKDKNDVLSGIAAAKRAFDTSILYPSIRVRAAHAAGRLLSTSNPTLEELSEARVYFAHAVRALPLLTPLHVSGLEQQSRLERFDAARLTADAVAISLELDGNPEASLSLLETGRGDILGNLLRHRLDTARLRDAYPSFADEIERLRRGIEECRTFLEISLSGDTGILDRRCHYRLRLAQLVDQQNKIYGNIRQQRGFEDFMLPVSVSQSHLIKSNRDHIITINLSDRRCDAIVINTAGISSFHLPKLSLAELHSREKILRAAIRNRSRDPELCRKDITSLREWLWDVCGQPLLADLGLLHAASFDSLPRVWWVLGGVLGRIPIHACGVYNSDSNDTHHDNMGKHVVSSYAPTVKALEYAQERSLGLESLQTPSHETLIVAVPDSKGSIRLVDAEVEAVEIQTLIRSTFLKINPTLSDVLDGLKHCGTAHFACQVISDMENPTGSYLKLRDFQETPLSVGLLMSTRTKLTHCKFAYLSACETGYSAREKLCDESLHLVSGFLLAGCPQVIGTLWEIPDDQARYVAKAFCSVLPRHEDGSLKLCFAAQSLHSVITALQKSPQYASDPFVWVPFIHAGTE